MSTLKIQQTQHKSPLKIYNSVISLANIICVFHIIEILIGWRQLPVPKAKVSDIFLYIRMAIAQNFFAT